MIQKLIHSYFSASRLFVLSLGLSLGLSQGLLSGCATEPEQTTHKELDSTEKAVMLIKIGNGALVEGDPTGALQNFARAEEEDADLPELHHSKALAYFAKHDLKRAIDSARQAVKLKPNYADANNTLGKLLLEAGDYKDAVGPLNIAAKDPLYRESFKAWTNLGILNYRQNSFAQAENYLNRAVLDAPNQACIALYYRGHIKLREAKFDEAIHDYDQATRKTCAKFGEAHLALGIAYEKNRQFELARKTFLEIQKRYPNTKLAEQALDQLRYLP
jgi:Tfp pilus assembly protein PilF